ncbi:hypothetical protein WJX74_007888 [Apatococcus lobatus]|uniref:Uncharacterized protein n=1 Tax=Apatococcus lobatus TaxID=904363 RepID=A0AAW1RVY6_9CHLO
MFLTSTLVDTVPVAAENLAKPTFKAVQEVLEELYLDRVIRDLGLGVAVYNVLDIKGGDVYPSDSSAYFTVTFDLVVFRPVSGEVLVGRLLKSDRSGLHVTLGFFSDIFIPDFNMMQPAFTRTRRISGSGSWKMVNSWIWIWMSPSAYVSLKSGSGRPLRLGR